MFASLLGAWLPASTIPLRNRSDRASKVSSQPLPVHHQGRRQGGHQLVDPPLQQCEAPFDPGLFATDRMGTQVPSARAAGRITMCPAGGGKLTRAREVLLDLISGLLAQRHPGSNPQ